MTKLTPAQLINNNYDTIISVRKFVDDERFVNKDTSDDGVDENGFPYDGFFSDGLIRYSYQIYESINQTLTYLENDDFLIWDKEEAIKQLKKLFDLYFDKLHVHAGDEGIYQAYSMQEQLCKMYPDENKDCPLRIEKFTKEYLEKILSKYILVKDNKNSDSKKRNLQEEASFIIGLLFAKEGTRERIKKLRDEKFSFAEIASDFKVDPSNQYYFNATYNNTKNGYKNICSKEDVIQEIVDYLSKKDPKEEICEDFKNEIEKSRKRLISSLKRK